MRARRPRAHFADVAIAAGIVTWPRSLAVLALRMTNVTGQMLGPVLAAKETGMLDREIYERAPTNVGIEEERAV